MSTSIPTASTVALQTTVEDALASFLAARSTKIEAGIFDLPTKMLFGTLISSPAMPTMIDAITASGVSAEELGRRMKTPGFRLGGLSLAGLLWVQCFGRLQRSLDRGWPGTVVIDPREEDDNAKVLAWFSAVAAAYRNDGRILPTDGRGPETYPILEEPAVRCLDERANIVANDLIGLRRAMGQLGLYAFTVHGEARDGIFNHGPYPLGDGTFLIVKEWTDLQNRWMPWVHAEERLEVSRVVIPLVIRDTAMRFDMFGTIFSEPQDLLEHVVRYGILLGDDLRPGTVEELSEVSKDTNRKSRGVFRRMVQWDAREKVLHTTWAHASHFATLMEGAGCSVDHIQRALVEPIMANGDRYIERMLSGEQFALWEHLAGNPRPLLPPVAR